MNSFKEKLLRLKNELKISTDKEIATILDMKPTAFAERKKTDSFPEKELFALKAKRPELDLDVDYILLGARREEPRMQETTPMPSIELSHQELALIGAFRGCSEQGKQAIMQMVGMMLQGDTSIQSMNLKGNRSVQIAGHNSGSFEWKK